MSRRRIFTSFVEVETSPVTSEYTNARKVGSKIYYQGPIQTHVGGIVGYEGRDFTVLDKKERFGVHVVTVREKS